MSHQVPTKRVLAKCPNKVTFIASALLSTSFRGNYHDEFDFECLGNSCGPPYLLRTNIFSCNASGGREQHIYLLFNPTGDFHFCPSMSVSSNADYTFSKVCMVLVVPTAELQTSEQYSSFGTSVMVASGFSPVLTSSTLHIIPSLCLCFSKLMTHLDSCLGRVHCSSVKDTRSSCLNIIPLSTPF